jgi:hypothetical protein
VLFRAETTALVNPSSSIADGAFTLIVIPALLAESLLPEPTAIALPLGTAVEGALVNDPEELTAGAEGAAIFGGVGVNGRDELETVLAPVELLCVKDGFEIVLISGSKGILL